MYKDVDLVLPISDHADFDELVRTATESGARRVWTVHGAAGFAAHLRTLGLDAEHLAEHPQDAGTTPPPGRGGQLSLGLDG
jgi:Cft2 family RNA processing exonuclease